MRRSKVVPQTSRLLVFSEAEISTLKKHSYFEFPNRLCLCLRVRLCVYHCQRLCRMIVADVLLFPTMFNMLITMTKSWKYRSFNDDRLSGWRRILRGLYSNFMGVILRESHSKVGTLWVRQIYQSHDYKTAACVNCSILCVFVCVCVCMCVCVCVGGGPPANNWGTYLAIWNLFLSAFRPKKHSDFDFSNRLCLCLCVRLWVCHCQRLCRMVADVLLFPAMFNMLITTTKSWKYRSFYNDRLRDWRKLLRGLYSNLRGLY